jgi:hexosaminidase
MLALHNINRMHWHLTDDQGWRIEIKKYPKLTEVGAYRPETVIGRNTGRYDGTPHQGFYTQNEVRNIIAYAAERHITIVPEIDLPGHMQAALAGYPEFGCTGGPYKVWQDWGVSDNVLCAGNDKTMQFVKDVLNEVVDLFPSEYIHVGGDECPKDQWKKCPKCQQRIRKEGLRADGKHSAEERLQSYVIRFAENVLAERGRKMIGWDEVLEGGLAPNATVMSWRGEGGGIEAARMKHDVIMTPNTYCYFDYYQTANKNSVPLAIGGYLPIERVYSYEPMPKQLEPEYHAYITGVQANLWTEYIPTFSHAQYMELPRMAALCEVQWVKPEQKDFDAFVKRLPRLIDLYEKLGYNYAKHVFEVQSSFSTDTVNNAVVATYKTIDDSPIYYTLDGTDPTTASNLYTEPVLIKESCTIKASSFRGDQATFVTSETFNFSKSTGCPITMLQPINEQYKYAGAITLVDGLLASDTEYQTGRWIAFYRNDMEAVIDLGEATSVNNVSFNVCVEKGAWIFNARKVEVAVSEDGENFVTVVNQEIPAQAESEPNEIYAHSYDFEPATARYIKVKATPEHKIPSWHGGKGNPAFLFIDEIIVK